MPARQKHKKPRHFVRSEATGLFMLRVKLKRQAPSYLPVARELLLGSFPSLPCQVTVESCEVYPVKDVEEFEPQLKFDSLGYVGNLVSIEVRLNEVRLPELTGLFVALGTKRPRNAELSRAKDAMEKCALRVPLLVAVNIGIVVVVSVSVVVSTGRLICDRWICG